MKPVIVLTVYRRYFELAANLNRIKELAGEFGEKPDVVVVWAKPELGRLWFFDRLRSEGLVQKLLTRQPSEGESVGQATSYPESRNIRLGLEWVRDNYDPATTYAIVQAGDVTAKPQHGYKYVDTQMGEGAGAVLFHWQNGCVHVDIWHTNFFAVRLDPVYWPPLSPLDCQDVLESQWGKQLSRTKPPGVVQSHNYKSKRFVHSHESEAQPEWPVIPLESGTTAPLLMTGYLPRWRRVLQWFGVLKPFSRPAD